MRNINPTAGLFNGIRLQITNIFNRLIEANINFGKFNNLKKR